MITLRPLEPEDLDLLYTIENAPENWAVGLPGTAYSRFALRNYIASQTSDLVATGQLRYVIEAENNAVGLIDLFNYDALAQKAEVGIAVTLPNRNKGFATEALNVLCLRAKETLNVHQLIAKIAITTHPSAREIFLRNQFRKIATLPDWTFQQSRFVDVELYSRIL